MNKLLLIDGNPIMHRAFHALPPFKTKTGIPTNVLYGFFSILYKTTVEFNPQYLIVCFDTPKPTFRNKIFPAYQAQRPKIADDFSIQIPLVKDGLDQAGIYRLEQDGVEADDLIGSISTTIDDRIDLVLIVSGDKDILQLINKKVIVISPQTSLTKMMVYDSTAVKKKLAIPPALIPDYKALVGDPSDNYPGAKGIGPKTAAKLINQFETIENIYQNLNQIDSKTRQILTTYKKDVFLSKKLAVIMTDLPLNLDFNRTKFSGFNSQLKDYLLQYEIYSLATRIFKPPSASVSTAKKNQPDQIGLF